MERGLGELSTEGGGLLNSLISFMGFLCIPRLVSVAPSSLAGHLPPQTLRLDTLQPPGPGGPGSGTAPGRGQPGLPTGPST